MKQCWDLWDYQMLCFMSTVEMESAQLDRGQCVTLRTFLFSPKSFSTMDTVDGSAGSFTWVAPLQSESRLTGDWMLLEHLRFEFCLHSVSLEWLVGVASSVWSFCWTELVWLLLVCFSFFVCAAEDLIQDVPSGVQALSCVISLALLLFFLFWDRVLPNCLGWPWTHYVVQANFELVIFLPQSPELLWYQPH